MHEQAASAGDAVRTDSADDVRARILAAAVELITTGGRDAATTRAVAAAAGVQPPALYRQFGDMRGLLDTAARETLAGYIRHKAARTPSRDPVEDLRRGWDLHVAFGLAHPAVYTLLYGDPTGEGRASIREGEAHLHALMTRVAAAGRLRVGVAHATQLVAAAGNGVTLALLATAPDARDLQLSDAMREAVLAAVTVASTRDDAPDGPNDRAPGAGRASGPGTAHAVVTHAVALRALLGDVPDAMPDAAPHVLSPAERHLLGEWLDRLAGAASAATR